jgi:hypothetical protein
MVFDSLFSFVFLLLIGLGLNVNFKKSARLFWGASLGASFLLISYYGYQYYFWPSYASARIVWLCLGSAILGCFFALGYAQKQKNWQESCRMLCGFYLLNLCLTTAQVNVFLISLFLMSLCFRFKSAAFFFVTASALYFFKEYPALIEDINVFQFIFNNDFFFKLFFYFLFCGFFFSRRFFFEEIELSPWKSTGYIFQRFCLTAALFRAQLFFSPDMFCSFLFYYLFFLIFPLYQMSFRNFHFEEWVLYWALWFGLGLRGTETVMIYKSFWETSAFFLAFSHLSWVFSVYFFQKSETFKEHAKLFFLSLTPVSAGFLLITYQIYALIESGFLIPPLCLLVFILVSFFRWRNHVMAIYHLFSKDN